MKSWIAWLASIVVSLLYVVAIYYHTPASLKGLERDDLRVIHHRMHRLDILTVLLIVIVPLLVATIDGVLWSLIMRYTGVVPGFTINHSIQLDLLGIFKLLILICSLYVGPITFNAYYYYKYAGDEGGWDLFNDFVDSFVIIQGFRDHVFAPITEELVYRSMVLTLFHQQGKTWYTMYLTPLLFGIAHIHHGYQMRCQYKDLPLKTIIFGTSFQTLYTTIFGILTNYLFYKYHTVWCCIMVHGVCNLLGFPSYTKYATPVIVDRDDTTENTQPDSEPPSTTSAFSNEGKNLYLVLLGIGIVLFVVQVI